MNAIIALCHFCELDGPNIVYCTQVCRSNYGHFDTLLVSVSRFFYHGDTSVPIVKECIRWQIGTAFSYIFIYVYNWILIRHTIVVHSSMALPCHKVVTLAKSRCTLMDDITIGHHLHARRAPILIPGPCYHSIFQWHVQEMRCYMCTYTRISRAIGGSGKRAEGLFYYGSRYIDAWVWSVF